MNLDIQITYKSIKSFSILFLVIYANSRVCSIEIFPVKSADVSRHELNQYRIDGSHWRDLVGAFIEGKGSLMERTENGKQFLADYNKLPKNQAAKFLNIRLSGDDVSPVDRNILLPGVYHNPALVFFQSLTDFPAYKLPKGAQHWILWTRVPEVSAASFAPLAGEKVPREEFLDKKKVAALVKYIKHFDFYGSYGFPAHVIQSLRASDFAHPSDEVIWKDYVKGVSVKRDLAVKAIEWAGRHINTVLKNKFPRNQFEVV